MAKPKTTCRMLHYGIYDHWDKTSKDLPHIKKISTIIPARLDIEFGYVLNIKKARGKKLHYCIEHPPFTDENNAIRPPFTGDLYVRDNDWDFFLGDTIWDPVSDKIGTWRLTTTIDGILVADQSFSITPDT
ncbi:MAG: DUF3859 domain-containing protein [Spartobacteria bacterium]|nr:DUF3859 domain-containing protein [Spartobacteria bacterium]